MSPEAYLFSSLSDWMYIVPLRCDSQILVPRDKTLSPSSDKSDRPFILPYKAVRISVMKSNKERLP